MNTLFDFWSRWRGSAREVEPFMVLPPGPVQHEAQPLQRVAESLGHGQMRLTASVDGIKYAVEEGLEQVLQRVSVLDQEQVRRVAALQASVDSLGWHLEAAWVRDLLPLLDSLRAAETAPRSWRTRLANWLVGSTGDSQVRALREGLERTLTERGVREIDVAGKSFDPELHVAVGVAATGQPQTVRRPGYTLAGRVVRPAEVLV